MRKCLILLVAFGTFGFAAGEAAAMKMTQQQVKNVCGKGLQSSGGTFGCERKCGDKLCSYNCSDGKNKQLPKGCSGFVVRTGGGGTGPNPPSTGLLETSPTLAPTGAAPTGGNRGTRGGGTGTLY